MTRVTDPDRFDVNRIGPPAMMMFGGLPVTFEAARRSKKWT
ncbi:hypothetical protein ABQF44_09335 [Mycolicibacterium porcinum]